ncbi:hypothetical protein AGMMS4957_10550 [Bacteroidia bacterium]|nr:hypothetical protein AGMMS4957_10550 [Bacteroidia bacterium]
MKTMQYIICLGLFLLFSLTACEESTRNSIDLSADVDIKSFSINGIDGKYANPQIGGINPTPYCASMIKSDEDTDDGGKPWSGGALWQNYKVNIDPAVYNKLSMMVLKNNVCIGTN